MNTLSQYFRNQLTKRVLIPVSKIRKQGFSSETLALSISIGIIGGMFPVIGLASYICLLLTLGFKQNIIIVQVANWISYPLQILLLIPFMKLGNFFFGGGDLTITIYQVVVAFQSGIMDGIRLVGILSLYAVIAWTVIAIPTLFILYTLFLLGFRNIKRIKLKTYPAFISKLQISRKRKSPEASTLVLETLPAKNNGLKN